MFKKMQIITLTSLGMILSCCQGQAQDTFTQPVEKTYTDKQDKTDKSDQIDMKKLSEAFGNFIGRNLQSPGLKFDMESLIKGIRGGAAGESSPLSEKEYEEMMSAVQEKAFKEMSAANLKNANDFMAKNLKEAGVVEVLPGKLQYLIIKEGTGPTVEATSSPKINYTGKYQDGTVFGTSEEMGGPITIPLDQTIPGFSKGIVGMKEGEKRRLFVHPDLGYGTSGQLPPNELLIFEIEVVKANSDEDKSKTRKDNSTQAGDNADDEDLFFEEDELENEATPSTTPSSKDINKK